VTGDNGNVTGITNNRDTTRSQAFTYDALNRILTAETTSTHATSPSNCWGESYIYDNQPSGSGAWGNLTNINVASTSYNGCTQETLSATANAQNQLSTNGYDTAGNAITYGTSTYAYNAENQMTQAAAPSATGYVYDGDGKRAEKVVGGSATKLYWYGGGTDTLDETDGTGSIANSGFNEYIFFGGTRIARRDSSINVFYYVADHLGTSREIVQAGQTSPCYESDFYPFGGERTPIVNACSQNNYKFTGKERDAESGLDNFGARYMASTMGRFMSADPFTVTPGRVVDPQQLNLYAYVRNNPLKHIDPTGMLIDDAACKQDMKHCGNDWQKVQDIANQQDKNGNYLHPELHNELTTLQGDSRTFVIENSKLDAGTAGLFTITNFSADGKDFTRATLQLDFKQIKGISGVTGADLVPSFNKYQGLLDSPIYRLAETFGHEGAHGLFSIQNPAQAVGIQQLLNQRDAAMQGQHYPYPPDVMQKMQAADQALIPTERFAQQAEKVINGELQADKKKQ
jgi:RHS repeat-associated protein